MSNLDRTPEAGRADETIPARSTVKDAPLGSAGRSQSDFVHYVDSGRRGVRRPFVWLRHRGDCGRDVVHRSRLPSWSCPAGTRGQRRDLWRVVRSAGRWNLLRHNRQTLDQHRRRIELHRRFDLLGDRAQRRRSDRESRPHRTGYRTDVGSGADVYRGAVAGAQSRQAGIAFSTGDHHRHPGLLHCRSCFGA